VRQLVACLGLLSRAGCEPGLRSLQAFCSPVSINQCWRSLLAKRTGSRSEGRSESAWFSCSPGPESRSGCCRLLGCAHSGIVSELVGWLTIEPNEMMTTMIDVRPPRTRG
jgi:hypothetical protein